MPAKQRVEEHELEKIVDERIKKGKQEFLVRWKGYKAADDTWQSYPSIKDTAAYATYLKKMKRRQ